MTHHAHEDVFAYLSDFSTAQESDPGVVEAERLSDSAIGEGTEFRLLAEFLGRKTTLTYRTVEYDPPAGGDLPRRELHRNLKRQDHVRSRRSGNAHHLPRELVLKGPLRIADPLLRLAFNRVGDRPLAGLRNKLAPTPAGELSPLRGRSLDGTGPEGRVWRGAGEPSGRA